MSVLERAISAGYLDDEQPWAVFFDLDALHGRFKRLERAFPADTQHAVAIKANPLLAVLRQLVNQGAGLEAASMGELRLALASGANPASIVFDSPAKTDTELAEAMDAGVYINADSLDELERIHRLNPPDSARIGIRVNPVVGGGSIEGTSVSTQSSKFGVSLLRSQRKLLAAFRNYPWLRGLHVHTGSQGYELRRLVEGVRRCVDFAQKLAGEFGDGRIDTIDIGGGLPVGYRPHIEAPTIEDYADALRDRVPEIFGRRWRLITEFGRWLHGPCAFAASRVETVKDSPRGPIAVIHFGADLMLRRAYRPDDWYHKVTIHDECGQVATGDEVELTVAGPLCFSGDLIVRGERKVRPKPGGIIVAHDVGAYTFSMWSRYCSRPFPRVIGFRHTDAGVEFEMLHRGESDADLVTFWER